MGDLYFVDPNPGQGQEGPEHGVRVELRVLGRGELKGSIYSAQPIEVGAPVWRADLLESVAGCPGSFDRTHYHPRFTGWNPNRRVSAGNPPVASMASRSASWSPSQPRGSADSSLTNTRRFGFQPVNLGW